MPTILSTLCFLSVFSSTLALQVSPGSACAEVCLDRTGGNADDPDASNTDTADITCKNSEYSSTGVGTKYKNCLECLMTSDSVDEASGESDVTWFLYNLRYAVDVCLYGFGNTTKVSSPCDIDTACLPLESALLDGDLEADPKAQYGFCDADDSAFQASAINACASCLKADTSQSYLANFLVGLQAGCEQKPEAGVILGLEGDLFSAAGVNITEPVGKDDDEEKSGMTVGTIVGIAVGAALLFLGGTAMFIVYFRRQRNQNHDNDKRAPGTMPSHDDSNSFQPTYGADHKKSNSFHSDIELKHGGVDANTHAHTASFSSNADFYDKLEEVMTTTRKKKYNLDPHAEALNGSAALPTHPAYIPKAMSRGNTPSPVPPPMPPAVPEPVAAPRKPSPPRQAPSMTARTVSPPPTLPPVTFTSPPPPVSPPSRHERQASYSSFTSGTKRANKPAPLQNISSEQKPGSWTLQKYLSNSEDTPIPIPPPPPMTGRSVMSQQSQQSQASNRSNFSTGAAVGTMTSQGPGTSGATLSPPLPPPPPGPPPSKPAATDPRSGAGKTTSPRRIPHLSIPSVPRIKVPKKYAPPSITVQGATPIEANDISGPMDPRTMATIGAPRFPDTSIGHNNGGGQEPPLVHRTLDSNGQVVETQLPMPSWRRFEAEEVQTGRSARLYG